MSGKLFLGLAIIISMIPFANAQESIDIEALINEALIDSQQDSFSGYAYQMEFVRSKRTRFGKKKLVKRYEAILPSRIPKNQVYRHLLLQVYDSDKPIAQNVVSRNRKRIIEKLERTEGRDDHETLPNPNKQRNGGYMTLNVDSSTVGRQELRIDLLKLVRGSSFRNPKRLKIGGRDVISIDFASISNKKFDADLFYLGRIEGIILIDESDKRIIEVEGFSHGKLSEHRQKPRLQREKHRVFHYLQTRVPEGFWFPKRITLNFMEHASEFNDLAVKIEFAFSEYRRPTVEVQSYQVKPRPTGN